MTLPTPPPTPPTGWGTDTDTVAAMLGPTVAYLDDPLAQLYVDGANAWCYRKRWEAGYVDDTAPAAADVVLGCSYYAVALWRERASVDGYQSFEQFPEAPPTGGASGQIRKLLGIGKARVDTPPASTTAAARHARWLRVVR